MMGWSNWFEELKKINVFNAERIDLLRMYGLKNAVDITRERNVKT
jgi:hypothetical protein